MSLALQVAAVVGVLVAVLPTYWVLSRLALRTSAPTVWLRRLLITLVPLVGVAYLLFTLVGLDDLVGGVVASILSGFTATSVRLLLAALAAQFTLFLSTAAVALAAYAVVVPSIRQARAIDLPTSTAVRRMGRYVGVLTVLLTVFFVPFRRIAAGGEGGLAPVSLIVLLLVVPFLTPLLVRVLRSVRAPEQSERGRVEALCERAGLDVDDVWILADADETVEIYLRGPPGRRHLYVSERALTAFDDGTLGALLAANAGSVRHHYRAITLSPLFGFLVASVAALAWGTPLTYALVIALALLLPLPVLWAARRAVRRADDSAAAKVGHEAVADALERSATVQNLDIPSGGLATVLKRRPPLGDRIDRLRNDEE